MNFLFFVFGGAFVLAAFRKQDSSFVRLVAAAFTVTFFVVGWWSNLRTFRPVGYIVLIVAMCAALALVLEWFL